MKFRFKRLWFLLLLPMALLGAVFYITTFRPIIWQLKDATALQLSDDGRVLVAQNDKLVRVYDCRWKRVIGDIPFSPDKGGKIVSVSADGSRIACIFVGQYSPLAERLVVFGVGTFSTSQIWSANVPTTHQFLDARFVGRRLRVLYDDGVTTFSPTGEAEGKIGLVAAPLAVTAGSLSPDASRAVMDKQGITQEDGHAAVVVFDTQSGQRVERWSVGMYEGVEANALWDFEFSRDGRTLTACSSHFLDSGYDPTEGPPVLSNRYYWSLPGGKLLRYLDDTGTLHSPFSPDGQAALREDTSRLWFEDIEAKAPAPAKFQIPLPFGSKKAWITDVRLSSDGNTIAALNEKGQIWLQRR